MSATTTRLIKTTLSALHVSRMDRAYERIAGVRGAILMLHHVKPKCRRRFSPNRILSITPEFFVEVLSFLRDRGIDFVTLDDVVDRLSGSCGPRPFVALTFDDGYRDNVEFALPILRRFEAPATIYVPSSFPDGHADLWWLILEEAIAGLNEVVLETPNGLLRARAVTSAEKEACFNRVYWVLRSLPEDLARSEVARLAAEADVDLEPFRRLAMTWDEVRELANDPLVTIGAHTIGHYALAKLDQARALEEMKLSKERLERELDRPCRHFSYPYGDEGSAGQREFDMARELGFATGVTTRKGVLRARPQLDPLALPRLSLNGDYQSLTHFKVLMSGLPFRLLDTASQLRGLARWGRGRGRAASAAQAGPG
ncbi:MAG: polysaccharide deacetylase family protein [Hyphomicrobiaceae bacterium]